jgi:hypothetical protein
MFRVFWKKVSDSEGRGTSTENDSNNGINNFMRIDSILPREFA